LYDNIVGFLCKRDSESIIPILRDLHVLAEAMKVFRRSSGKERHVELIRCLPASQIVTIYSLTLLDILLRDERLVSRWSTATTEQRK
jgi:hypothetical protein